MAKRDRLGRGLNALLGDYLDNEGEGQSGTPRMVAVGEIAPNPFQPRRELVEGELAELEASMRENGLLQPIVVRPGAGGVAAWELVAGERRWRAAMRLGWREVPALVRDVDDRTLLVLALVENVQRAQLAPLEEAAAYRRLGDEFGLSHQEIAQLVGRDRSTVANTVRLLQLPASVRHLLNEGRLTAGHARALLAVGNELRMADLAKRAADDGLSVREVEAEARRLGGGGNGRPRRQSRDSRDAAERRLEAELQRALGTAVRIRGGGTRGRIEIPFYNAEDFERLFELLVGRPAAEVVS